MHIFNKGEEKSVQRLAQLQSDEPVSVFYAFDFSTNSEFMSSHPNTKFGGNFLS